MFADTIWLHVPLNVSMANARTTDRPFGTLNRHLASRNGCAVCASKVVTAEISFRAIASSLVLPKTWIRKGGGVAAPLSSRNSKVSSYCVPSVASKNALLSNPDAVRPGPRLRDSTASETEKFAGDDAVIAARGEVRHRGWVAGNDAKWVRVPGQTFSRPVSGGSMKFNVARRAERLPDLHSASVP